MLKMNLVFCGCFNYDLISIVFFNIWIFDVEVLLIKGIVKLILGELDFNVLIVFKNVVIQVIEGNDFYYIFSVGMVVLCEVIVYFFFDCYDLIYDFVIEIVVMVGVIEVIFVSFEVFLNFGDKVIILILIFLFYEMVV